MLVTATLRPAFVSITGRRSRATESRASEPRWTVHCAVTDARIMRIALIVNSVKVGGAQQHAGLGRWMTQTSDLACRCAIGCRETAAFVGPCTGGISKYCGNIRRRVSATLPAGS